MIFLIGLLLGNMFSGQKSTSYQMHKPESPPQAFKPNPPSPVLPQNNDNFTKYAKLSSIPRIVSMSEEACYKNMNEGHPNIQSIKNPELYKAVKRDSGHWNQLVHAWEDYTSSVCYPFSGIDVETVFANSIREQISKEEMETIMLFNETQTGKKLIQASNVANSAMQKYMAEKSLEAVKKYFPIYANAQTRIFSEASK